jgi:hypothetical protein
VEAAAVALPDPTPLQAEIPAPVIVPQEITPPSTRLAQFLNYEPISNFLLNVPGIGATWMSWLQAQAATNDTIGDACMIGLLAFHPEVKQFLLQLMTDEYKNHLAQHEGELMALFKTLPGIKPNPEVAPVPAQVVAVVEAPVLPEPTPAPVTAYENDLKLLFPFSFEESEEPSSIRPEPDLESSQEDESEKTAKRAATFLPQYVASRPAACYEPPLRHLQYQSVTCKA